MDLVSLLVGTPADNRVTKEYVKPGAPTPYIALYQ
jgi:hypothetical protein